LELFINSSVNSSSNNSIKGQIELLIDYEKIRKKSLIPEQRTKEKTNNYCFLLFWHGNCYYTINKKLRDFG